MELSGLSGFTLLLIIISFFLLILNLIFDLISDLLAETPGDSSSIDGAQSTGEADVVTHSFVHSGAGFCGVVVADLVVGGGALLLIDCGAGLLRHVGAHLLSSRGKYVVPWL